jgi:hypothetical protein
MTMTQEQDGQRTVRLTRSNPDGPAEAAQSETDTSVVIAAIGVLRRAAPGRTIRETLLAESIPLPGTHQEVLVNGQPTRDLDRRLGQNTVLKIVQRVAGGSASPGQPLMELAYQPVDQTLTPAERQQLLEKGWHYQDLLAGLGFADVATVGLAPLSDRVVTIGGDAPSSLGANATSGSGWVVMPLAHDPLYTYGAMPIPGETLERLRAAVRAGLDFPIYTAHEVAPEWLLRIQNALRWDQPIPRGAIAPADARRDRVAGTGPGSASHPRARRGWSSADLLTFLGLTIGAAVMTTAVLGHALASVDPVLLAAIPLREPAAIGEPAIFLELARWNWPVAPAPTLRRRW